VHTGLSFWGAPCRCAEARAGGHRSAGEGHEEGQGERGYNWLPGLPMA